MIRKFKEQDTDCVIGIWMEASSMAHPFLNTGFVKKVEIEARSMLEKQGKIISL